MQNHKMIAALMVPITLLAWQAHGTEMLNGLTFSGDISTSSLTSEGDPLNNAQADVGLSWRNPQAGNLGFDLDLTASVPLGTSRDFWQDSTTFWGGVVVATESGDLTLGNPRGLASQVNTASDSKAVRLLEGIFGFTGLSNQSMVEAWKTSLDTSGIENITSTGVTFFQADGPVRYGFGLHRIGLEDESFAVTEMTLSYDVDAAQIYGLYETLDDDFGGTVEKSVLGASYDLEKWNFGVELINVSFADIPMKRNKIYAGYLLSDRITLSAQAEHFNFDGDTSSVLALEGELRLGSNAYAELGLIKAADAAVIGFDRMTSLSLGYRF